MYGRQGFFMLMSMETQVDTGKMNYIIRDHDKNCSKQKAFFLQAGQTLNEIYGREVCEVSVKRSILQYVRYHQRQHGMCQRS